MWRKLLIYRKTAKHFHRVELGNGNNTSLWLDHWSSIGRMHDITCCRGYIDMGIQKYATLASSNEHP